MRLCSLCSPTGSKPEVSPPFPLPKYCRARRRSASTSRSSADRCRAKASFSSAVFPASSFSRRVKSSRIASIEPRRADRR
eukprot:SAG22_NODE_665_length_8020_cov_22.612296_6_plen_80_part_00